MGLWRNSGGDMRARLGLRALVVLAVIAAAFAMAGPTRPAAAVPTGAAAPGGGAAPAVVVPAPSGALISAGSAHTCAVTAVGGVRCWGENADEQLGNDSTLDATTPVDVSGLASGVVAVSAGTAHTCALTSVGGVWCWGSDANGQLGNGPGGASGVPVAVVGLGSGVTSMSTSASKTCAVVAGGSVWCWGGFTPNGTTASTVTDATSPVAVAGTEGATAVATGASHACARTTVGGVVCWGYGASGQIGNGSTNDRLTVPAPVTGLDGGVAEISAGALHTCARTALGSVVCWGRNAYGQLGNNSTTDSSVPVDVGGLDAAATAIDAGHSNACVVLAVGGLRCWGAGSQGSLGIGRKVESAQASVVLGDTAGAAAVAVGGSHSCLLTAGGVARCWGRSASGELGTPISPTPLVPVEVVGLPDPAVQVEGGFDHTCARTDQGEIWCWGEDRLDQLGTAVRASSSLPVEVEGLTGPATNLEVGGFLGCVIEGAGAARCWGQVVAFSLFSLPLASFPTATPFPGMASNVSQLASGQGYLCARKTNATATCWGKGTSYQLGTSNPFDVTGAPAAVLGMGGGISSIAAGTATTCAISPAQSVSCWGANDFGQVGDGGSSPVQDPYAPPALQNVAASVDVGYGSTCVVRTDSGLSCFGAVVDPPTPTAIAGLDAGIADVHVGSGHVCALKANGSVWCFGANGGRLGNGGTASSSAPVAVSGLGAGVTAIGGGADHTCAVTAAGSTWCWGVGDLGQLGDGVWTPQAPVAGGSFAAPTTSAPGAPTALSARAADRGAHLSWVAPATSGGSDVTDYVITPRVGGVPQAPIVVGAPATSHTVRGLANATTYTFTIAAVNAVGAGPPSDPSAAVTPQGYRPFSTWAGLIERLYLDLVARPPTSAEVDAWTGVLSNGTKAPGELAAALRTSDENTTNVDPAVRLYRAFLGRAPDRSGLEFWIRRRRTGTWTLVRMADHFAGSSEFVRTYGTLTNRQFVTRIYTDVLGRTADPAGVDYWTRQLDLRRRSRGSVMVGFSESNEYKRKQVDNTDVAVAHIFLLDRAATSAETTTWLERRITGDAHEDVLDDLLDSAAYAEHVSG